MKPTLAVQGPLDSERSTLVEDVSIQCQHQDHSQAKAANNALAQIELKEICPARARNDTLDAFCSTFVPTVGTVLLAESVLAPERALLFSMMR